MINVRQMVGGSAQQTVESRHPSYNKDYSNWQKWRATYEGGKDFVIKYLVKFSKKETDAELADRRTIAYCPNFCRAAVEDTKNSIFQRIADVERVGGPQSYKQAVTGIMNGVDLQHSSMGEFIGDEILPELLVMKRVGVIIDNERDLGSTQAEKGEKHPYLDVFRAEDILNWAPRRPVHGYDSLLLREFVDDFDEFGLPSGTKIRYRLYRKLPEGGVSVLFYDEDGQLSGEPIILDIEKIPFVVFEVSQSLLNDVADYQIALLNLESSDISFARKANFPFFYEFYDALSENTFGKGPGSDGTSVGANTSAERDTEVGMSKGRRYGPNLNAPGFISPDPGTLEVSMKKGTQLKEDIRSILNLNLQNMNPRRSSADSKEQDSKPLEAALSFIGLVLQKGEREIGYHWRAFEGEGEPVTVSYPKSYSLRTDFDRQEEATRLNKLRDSLTSVTAKKAIAKKIARILISDDLTPSELKKVDSEIDEAKTLTSDPSIILPAHKAGLVQDLTASDALGFDGKSEVEQAKKDRAERIKLTMEAQGGMEGAGAARGAPEFDKGQTESSEEKADKTKRGQGSEVE